MSYAQQMVETHPLQSPVDARKLAECIEACFDCVQACASCADACLNEDDPKSLSRCIRLDLDCADICDATGRMLSRQTAFDPEMARAAVEVCARACKLCGDECDQHASHHEHCKVCAEACRRCENSCNELLQAL